MIRPRVPPIAWVVCGLTLLFVLVPLAPALFGQGTLLDVGAMSAVLPFRAEVGTNYLSAVTCRQDTFDYYLPGVAEIKRSVLAGSFPTWAPYEVGGAPLASLPNHGMLSPMSLPYWTLPLWLAPAYVKFLEFTVAIAGMVLFLRRLGLSRVSGLVAGIVFAGSGFMIMWTNWPHTRVAALIPAFFWALERLVQEIRARDVVLVAVVVASMLLGGFPAIVLFAHTLAAPYVLVRIAMLYRPRPARAVAAAGAAAAAVVLGVGLSAVQVIPFAANLAAFDYPDRTETGRHLPLYTAFTLVDPYAVGTCVGGEWFGRLNAIEAVGFIGGAAVLLAAAALILRPTASGDGPPTAFFAVAAVVLGTAIWVGGPTLAALQMLPLWSTNAVGRAQSVFGFTIAVLIGVGFDRLYRRLASSQVDPPSRLLPDRAGARIALLVTGLALVAVVVTTAMVREAREDGFMAYLRSTLAGAVLVLVLGAVAIVVASRSSRRRSWALAVLVGLIVVQSTAFAHTLLPTSRLIDFYPRTPTHTYLSEHLGEDRYAAKGNLMFAPTSDFYRLRTPTGHEFTDPRWKDLLRVADPAVQRTATYFSFSNALPIDQVTRSPALDQLAVRYWVAHPRTVIGTRDPIPAAPAGRVDLGPATAASCTVRGGAVRGVRVRVAEAMPRTPDGTRPMLHAAITSGGVERRGAVLIDTAFDPGNLFISIAGEDLPASETATVRFWLTDTDGVRVFRGRGDRLACGAVRPADDGVRLVHSDAGGAIYERLGALPRIRWAAKTRVVPERAVRLALLKAGLGADTVLLEDARLPAGQGRPAEVVVRTDERETIRARVRAEGAGYLVVADSIARPGWQATIDGAPRAIEHGNHAFAAIPVPEGEHVVEFRYVAPGLKAGIAVTIVSLVIAAVPVVGPTLARLRRRRGAQNDVRAIP